MDLEQYFEKFRQNTIGHHKRIQTPNGEKEMIYADWVASGRLYKPIEDRISQTIGPYVGNTHTETSETGTLMTKAYHHAHKLIKEHVNACETDVIITSGFGMTAVVNKLQRMLGLKFCGTISKRTCLQESEKPVVFITHMEHHSNHTSWYETIADVVQLEFDDDLLVDPESLRRELERYKNRKVKIGSFTACSNVTGISTPYHKLAKIMHEYGGWCFVDFAASAPYVDIDMHPGDDPEKKLDAVMFSPHKFLGGPGTSGVLVFDQRLYKNVTPDNPGGGTVDWTNPWGEFKYIDDIEAREDGGTPGFLQAIRTALCIEVKNQMGTDNIRAREDELVRMAFEGMNDIPDLHILADNITDRLGIISFYIEDIHYNLLVRLLNDRYGVQVRGGCACAGTYGHYLLDVSWEQSHRITQMINSGDLSQKPGWVRLSLHPAMTNAELQLIIKALQSIREHHADWAQDYWYDKYSNEFYHKSIKNDEVERVKPWFSLD
ncbi:MAG: aminotransferase class V-fold PLP-dependent enzyme [Bacteroidales bacterium]